ALIPPNNLKNEPELQKEAEAARRQMMAEQQKEFRKMMPPLNELLNQEQMRTAMRGNPEQVKELLEYLDPETRPKVAAMLPPDAVAGLPDIRRQSVRSRFPQGLVLADMREGKVFRALYSTRQLEEVLVDFWMNHFNVFEGKAFVRPLLPSYERDAIRPHVLGKFKGLL